MDIRPARPGEEDALAALFRRSRNQGMTYVPPVPEEALSRIAADIFARNEDVWVAEEAGRLLGFLAIRRSRRNGWEVLERLYVEPDEQGRGVGTALLEQAKALRPRGLYLWVFEKNEGARRLYERHGFRLVALRLGAAADNGEREADALYAWPGVEGLAERRSSSGRDARSEARTQGARGLASPGATEDTASGRAAWPDGSAGRFAKPSYPWASTRCFRPRIERAMTRRWISLVPS